MGWLQKSSMFLTPTAYNDASRKNLYGFNSEPNHDEASRASRVSFDPTGHSAN
jgi:hypothetical protein